MGISPNYWGKQGWHFIHYVALNYPYNPTDKDKERYTRFLENLPEILPCPICGEHFKENMKKHPPNLETRIDFFNWTVDMHNFVNEANGKKKYSYQQALDELERNPQYVKNAFAFTLSITAFVLLTTYLLSKRIT